jgi:hypothetical protein
MLFHLRTYTVKQKEIAWVCVDLWKKTRFVHAQVKREEGIWCISKP